MQQVINKVADELVRTLNNLSLIIGNLTSKVDNQGKTCNEIKNNINDINEILTNDKNGLRLQLKELSNSLAKIQNYKLEEKKGFWNLRNLIIIAIINGLFGIVIYLLNH